MSFLFCCYHACYLRSQPPHLRGQDVHGKGTENGRGCECEPTGEQGPLCPRPFPQPGGPWSPQATDQEAWPTRPLVPSASFTHTTNQPVTGERAQQGQVPVRDDNGYRSAENKET